MLSWDDNDKWQLKEFVASDYFRPSTVEDLERDAMDRGMKVIFPAENEIFIDIDNVEQLQRFWDGIGHVEARFDDLEYRECPSPTFGHKHIVVSFPQPLSHFERIAYQAALGSDPLRELLALLKSTPENPAPVCFFEAL